MTTDYYYLGYFLVGFIYWAVNIFVRKLHTKNDSGEGWFLVPLWLFGWPLCFLGLLVGYVVDKRKTL